MIAVAGTMFGLGLFPYSNVFVLGLAVSGGVVLGRVFPSRFRPLLAIMLILSVVDLIQVAALGGPPTPVTSAQQGAPDPHLIWLNVRIPLPSGHFAIGFADLLLVVALAETMRRSRLSPVIAAIPGPVAIVAGTLIASTSIAQTFLFGAFSEALIPYLTAGWLLAIFVRGRVRTDTADAGPNSAAASSART